MGAEKIRAVGKKIETNPIFQTVLNQKVFVYIYFLVCVLQSIPILIDYISPISKACFLWAVVLLAWDVLRTHRVFRMSCWALPLCFLASYGVSVLLNAGEALSGGAKHFIHCAIFMLLVYEAHVGDSRQEIMQSVKRLCRLLVGIVAVLSTVSLVIFSLGFSQKVNGYKVGFWENRLYGIYPSPNPGALLALLAIIASVILLACFEKPSRKARFLYGANIVIQTVYFALTLSKAGDLALITFVVAFAVVWGLPRVMRRTRAFLAVPLLAAGILVMCLATTGVTSLIRTAMAEVPAMVNTVLQPSDDPVTDIEFERVESGEDISNNRFTIWSSGLKVMDQAPVFGFADVNTESEAGLSRFDMHDMTEKEQTWFIRVTGYMHNSYLQILMFAGIAGLLIFLVLAVFIVKHLALLLYYANKKCREYTLISILFAICAAFVVNGVVESHLLFNRQDPIGLLFWFFLGAAVSLGNAFRGSEHYFEDGSKETFAFVAATPLQVLHAAEFVGNDIEGAAGSTDLYIVHSFQTAAKLSEGAKKSGLFNNVYDLMPRPPRKGLRSKLATFYDLFFPYRALKGKSCGDRLALREKGYQYVCASSQTTFTIGLHLVFPNAEVYLYDDGIGSYYGSMVHDYNSGLFEMMNRIFFDGKLIMEPTAMYLAVPELCGSTLSCERRKLPSLPAEKMPLLEAMFGYQANTLYSDKRIVYLSQPFSESAGIDASVEPKVINVIEKYLPDAIVRVHPRQKAEAFGSLERDSCENLWEMECLKQISDKNILISHCSTAQFMPKLMNGGEPYVIFLYKVFGNQLSDALAALVSQFTKLYGKQDHIFIPETLAELEEILDKLMKE